MLSVLACLVAAPQGGGPVPSVDNCATAQKVQVSVDSIRRSHDEPFRILRTTELEQELSTVAAESNACQRAIALQLARLLDDQRLRLPVAIALYRLGPNAMSARYSIRAAYRDQTVSVRQRRHVVFGSGSDVTTLRSLRCLDSILSGKGYRKDSCYYLDSASKD